MSRESLSAQDANATLDLIHATLQCEHPNDFLTLLECLKQLIGFDQSQCIYGNLEPLAAGKPDSFVAVSNFDAAWLQRYLENNYFCIDAVAMASLERSGLHYWDDAREKFATKQTRRVDQDAKAIGLQHGWIYTLLDGHSPLISLLSLAGERVEKTPRSLRILELVMPHLAEALKRATQAERTKLHTLTPRETEILNWLAGGKTAWEISVILKISQRTVQFHIANIITKLDATNARHAVAIAAAEGLVRP